MKRALFAVGVLFVIAIIAGAFATIGPRPRPGPTLAPLPISAATLATIVADLELAQSDDARHVVFGRRFANANPHDFRATIVVFDGSDAHEVPLSLDFDGLGWVHATRSRDGTSIWALADNVVESPGWTLELVASDDAGATWRHLSTVPKPYYCGQFETFQMSRSGKGLVGIRLDTPAPSNDASWLSALMPARDATGDEQPEGLYVYRTQDGGLTWSDPQFFDDDTEDAWETVDHVPDGFQPVLP